MIHNKQKFTIRTDVFQADVEYCPYIYFVD